MEVSGVITVDTPRAAVINEMQKPEVLEQVLPNCERVDQTDEDLYSAIISEKISMISLDLELDLEIVDFDPPDSFTVVVEGDAPGNNTAVHADTTYTLSSAESDKTEIDYYMDIEVSGKLTSLGFRLLKRTVTKRIDQMAANMEQQFSEPETDA